MNKPDSKPSLQDVERAKNAYLLTQTVGIAQCCLCRVGVDPKCPLHGSVAETQITVSHPESPPAVAQPVESPPRTVSVDDPNNNLTGWVINRPEKAAAEIVEQRGEIATLRQQLKTERNTKADAVHACMLANIENEELKHQLAEAQKQRAKDISAMVDRFLGWKLPKDFAPDGGIILTGLRRAVEGDCVREYDSHWWPVGTNLFTADQARQMFEYVLASAATKTEEAQ